MNSITTSVHGESIGPTMSSHMASNMMADRMSEPSSPENAPFDESDLLNSTITDVVTAQLAAAGPIGVAAAAAIVTGKKRKRPHSFETNPSIRRRQQTRLLRKLKATIEEYTTRVGQQAVVLCCTPGKPTQNYQSFKVFGSQPLENVVKNCRGMIMQDLETALAQQAPPAHQEDTSLYELPPLVLDGIPMPVDKMTQAQLRAFIPEMLKYSTGRSKPNWGKPEYRPLWWPTDVPWANVRSDVRTEDEKKKVSWTHALRQIVKNCYKHHGREDLLPVFNDESSQALNSQQQYTGTMVQTITNPDGTVSIIQIDTGPAGSAVVTLADGTQATVVHAIPDNPQQEASQAVQTLAEVAAASQQVDGSHPGSQHTPISVEMSADGGTVATLTEATLHQDGLLLTGDSSLGGKYGIVTIPVSMYQTVATSITSLTNSDTHGQDNVHITMAPSNETQNGGDVPDATHAVEVMTVE